MSVEQNSGLGWTLLAIDDDAEFLDFVKAVFKKEPQVRVITAQSGLQGLRMAAAELPDLITLDVNLPDLPGREICRRLREREKTFSIPVLIVSADTRAEQEIACLELGADDYLAKPVGPARLLARARSLIRRVRFRGDSRGVLRMGGAQLDTLTHRLSLGRRRVDLTPLESGLLALLMSAEGRPVDKKTLHKKLFGAWPQPRSGIIKVHVHNIKRKAGALIACHKDAGYAFDSVRARLRPG